ncbi:MAG: homocysteine S-methyltransferase family protein [Planctomycetota bacterium]|nr:homocysteine S-methyltransferase family protein [Planctomycetota bacterium]
MNVLDKDIILLDGATGTELGRRGADLSLPLWSAHAIEECPELLEEVHRDYLKAGADAITTCTFRTERWTLNKVGYSDEQAKALTTKAVEIAKRARDAIKPEALILGSIAPLEECYRADLAPDADICAREHGWMIETLLEAGVDVILIETQNCLHESMAAIERARELAPFRGWMASFCVDREGPPCTLLSGESLTEVLPTFGDALAIGVNCVAAPNTESQIKLMRKLVPTETRISAYANIGYADPMGNWINTDAVDPERFANYAGQWITDGATMIGGCCGTRPEMIKAIAGHLHQEVG